MKYITHGLLVIFIFWLALVPVAKLAKPGQLLYGLRVGVNEPVWTFIRVTGEGRAEALESQLAARYRELEAVAAGRTQAAQAKTGRFSAVWAEDLTFGRARDFLSNVSSHGNYRAVDTLAAHALGLLRAHRLLIAGLTNDASGGSASARIEVLAALRSQLQENFHQAYTNIELVRGIDEKLADLEALLSRAEAELNNAPGTGDNRAELFVAKPLEWARELQKQAKSKLGADQYVDSYMLANEAEGLGLEAMHLLESADFWKPVSK